MTCVRSRFRFLSLLVTLAVAAACGRAPVPSATANGGAEANAPVLDAAQQAEAQRTVILFLGDSLTAGLGLTLAQAYPNRVLELFANEGYDQVDVQNAGVSGDTTAGGLRRVESLLAPNVKIVVVALGGNDALRGSSVAQTRANLEAIVDLLLQHGRAVLLAGMEAPTNLGGDYQQAFHDAFVGLLQAHRGGITFMPFLLEGVAGDPSLNQADGIHPNDAGARIIAQHMYPLLRDMVDQLPVVGG
jgi:acyl-CoA thioesterase-1